MKQSLLLLLLVLFSSNSAFSQSSCIDFSVYDNAYLNEVTFNDTLHPRGVAFMQTGDIQFVKPFNGPTLYQFVTDTSLMYIGNIEINVSNTPYNNKKLTFNSLITQGLVVDGDTIFSNNTSPAHYVGVGFTLDFAAPTYTIIGDFDVVHIFGSTNFLSFVCVEEVPMSTSSCIDFTPYDNAYLNEVTSNDTLYPAGTAFIETGDIQLVKPEIGFANFYQFVSDTNMCYIGKIEINVSSTAYNNKKLTFNSIYTQGLVVDGDTIFTSNNCPAHYNGVGFTIDFAYPTYTIIGDFDVAHIFGSTNCLSFVCVEEMPMSTSSCLDFSAYDDLYMNEVTFNDTLHPRGVAFMQTGDIQIVKPFSGTFNSYQFVTDTSLLYIGNIEINVSSTPYNNKKLTFNSLFTQGLVVDGDTIFSNNTSPAHYVGAGFTIDFANPTYTITGDFDVVHIFGSTNILSFICVEEVPFPLAVETIEPQAANIKVYPNPSSGIFNISIEGNSQLSYSIYTINGNIIRYGNALNTNFQIDLSDMPTAVYFARFADEKGFQQTIKLLITN